MNYKVLITGVAFLTTALSKKVESLNQDQI